MVKQKNTWYAPRNKGRSLSPIQHEEVWSHDLIILDISEYFAEWQDTVNTLLKSKMSTHPPCIQEPEVSAEWKPSQGIIYRGISLYKTSGRQKQPRSSNWSPRPNRKQQPLPYGMIASHPSAKQHNSNKMKYQNNSTMKKSPRKRVREMTLTGSLIDLVLVISSEYETETPDGQHLINLSPQSPHDHEKAP